MKLLIDLDRCLLNFIQMVADIIDKYFYIKCLTLSSFCVLIFSALMPIYYIFNISEENFNYFTLFLIVILNAGNTFFWIKKNLTKSKEMSANPNYLNPAFVIEELGYVRLAVVTLIAILSIVSGSIVYDIAFIFFTLACYFDSCNPHPPSKRFDYKLKRLAKSSIH